MVKPLVVPAYLLLLCLLVACEEAEDTTDDDGGAGSSATSTTASGSGGATAGSGGGGGSLPFALTSTAFTEGETIPLVHECGSPAPVSGPGDNETPPLTWTAGPSNTQSYAIVVRDVDATVPQFPNGIIHWVVYDIPATTTSLPQNVAPGYEPGTPAGAKHAEIQGSGYHGYFGPCSPNSVNTYVFTVHAMASPTLDGVTQDTTEKDVAALVESTSIASASLSGES